MKLIRSLAETPLGFRKIVQLSQKVLLVSGGFKWFLGRFCSWIFLF